MCRRLVIFGAAFPPEVCFDRRGIALPVDPPFLSSRSGVTASGLRAQTFFEFFSKL